MLGLLGRPFWNIGAWSIPGRVIRGREYALHRVLFGNSKIKQPVPVMDSKYSSNGVSRISVSGIVRSWVEDGFVWVMACSSAHCSCSVHLARRTICSLAFPEFCAELFAVRCS